MRTLLMEVHAQRDNKHQDFEWGPVKNRGRVQETGNQDNENTHSQLSQKTGKLHKLDAR